ncbi:MAG: SDR family oxidoreductase [Saprospiraceae bacterium]|nr:SDR family oxidoreductase [Saprospiraceae bacterium]
MKNNYLIIGASSGIGKSLAGELSHQHSVFGTYNHHPVSNGDATYFYYNALEDLDVSLLPDVLHGFTYCPGTINLKPFARFTEQMFIDDYRVQVTGAIKCLQAVLPRLKQAEQASVVFFSTVAVQTGFPFHSLVSASKGAIEGLTKALAAELSPKIRVNCIAPSLTHTALAGNMLDSEEKIAANANRHPLKKIGQPEDIAKLAAFLLSADSSWITGQILHIDGGISTLKS